MAGLGYERLARFAKEQQTLTEQYYEDPEYWDVKLTERLEQMGFIIGPNGHIYGAQDADGKTVPTKLLTEVPHG